jgi:hypothetical protein
MLVFLAQVNIDRLLDRRREGFGLGVSEAGGCEAFNGRGR